MITLNEELSVKKVINDIYNLDNRIEIVIVDSSSDCTAEIAKSMGVKVYKQIPPQGYGPAMDMAFKATTRDLIITLDCDDTYPVNEIDNFSKKIFDEQYDVIDGNRLQKKPKNMPIINYLANYFFALIASMLFMIRIKDLHSGMRAYKKNIISRIMSNLPCPYCTSHAVSYLSTTNFKSIQNINDLTLYLFNFHNNVNIRLNKPTI